jgi:hypothetical protein
LPQRTRSDTLAHLNHDTDGFSICIGKWLDHEYLCGSLNINLTTVYNDLHYIVAHFSRMSDCILPRATPNITLLSNHHDHGFFCLFDDGSKFLELELFW